MKKTNHIGLDIEKSNEIADSLNVLLSNYQIFYTNLRGFHWNIKGRKFFELHIKFEELYNDIQIKIDEIAERILTLGSTPEHNYSAYVKVSSIKETNKIKDGDKAVANILESFKILIAIQRGLLDLTDQINDEGSNAMLSDYIREQEKLVWMYASFMA